MTRDEAVANLKLFKKSKKLCVHLEPQLYTQIMNRAGCMNLSLSEYMRQLAVKDSK